MKSKRYTLGKEDLINIFKVVFYTTLTALVTSLIMVLQETEVPVEYAVLVPIVNTILVVAKKYLSGKVEA